MVLDLCHDCVIYGPLQCADHAQGKVAELRAELDSGGKKDKNFSAKKIAMKKIVANMTMNNNEMVALYKCKYRVWISKKCAFYFWSIMQKQSQM
jgi:hypothetical protein